MRMSSSRHSLGPYNPFKDFCFHNKLSGRFLELGNDVASIGNTWKKLEFIGINGDDSPLLLVDEKTYKTLVIAVSNDRMIKNRF